MTGAIRGKERKGPVWRGGRSGFGKRSFFLEGEGGEAAKIRRGKGKHIDQKESMRELQVIF